MLGVCERFQVWEVSKGLAAMGFLATPPWRRRGQQRSRRRRGVWCRSLHRVQLLSHSLLLCAAVMMDVCARFQHWEAN